MNTHSERGHVLIWALVLLAIASAIGANVLTRHRTLVQETTTDSTRLQDLHAAEAGLERCRVELAKLDTFRGAKWTVGSQSVVVDVEKTDSGWTVTSWAGVVRLVATLAPGEALPRVVTWRE